MYGHQEIFGFEDSGAPGVPGALWQRGICGNQLWNNMTDYKMQE